MLAVTPPNGAGETDADFGVTPFFVQAFPSDPTILEELDGTITITDPGFVSAVPEPATLAPARSWTIWSSSNAASSATDSSARN